MVTNKLLFSLSKDRGDFTIEYYNGTGNGGQNRNKVATACRIHHPASGALAWCQEERNQKANRERAFKLLTETPVFKKWMNLETARRAGKLDDIDRKVDAAMKQVKVEIHDEKGRWREATTKDFIEVLG
jgi:protein subunit release factor B